MRKKVKTNLLLVLILGAAAQHQVAGGAAHHPTEDAGLHPVQGQPGVALVLHGYLPQREPGLFDQLQLDQIASLQAVELVEVLEVYV